MRYTKLKSLERLRAQTVKPVSCGLSNDEVEFFAERDPLLDQAICSAIERIEELQIEFPELTKLDESELLEVLRDGFLSFYPEETSSPYVPLTAKGPWVITFGGAVIYDTGGYGMLGHGHNPDCIREAMAEPQVMANIMTPSFSRHRFVNKIRNHVGRNHSSKKCPFDKFVFMNSGSEGMGVALRISDSHAKRITDPGARHEGKSIKALSFLGSFHGRTYRAARISSSTRKKYDAALASFRDHSDHIEVRCNDAAHLRELFEKLEGENSYVECIALEPVMGEGNPGSPLEREFYDVARELTTKHESFLIIDSIQAGLRAHGVLSLIDYPGYGDCLPPDIEIYSKALNGGQYPLSVVAMQQWVADQYVSGTYGNTMTASPRALDIASTVLNACSPELEKNIQTKGKEFVERLKSVQQELGGVITKVQGTGLLVSAELREDIAVVGHDAVEQRLRKTGVNVIHGGKNSLRYTPWFLVSSEEIDLIVRKTKEVLLEFS
ncbi:MAG: aminotransferase class III-fold pyridoxal phosphate-dependent enzyme [Bdellovibrionales bacterium]|nr:aminotransferase class III-fold pyridoxal phosphate-dependent enzyme [Bdellovibrionales bacterium]